MTEINQYVYYRVNHLFRRFSGKDKSYCHPNTIVFLSICLMMNISALAFFIAFVIIGTSCSVVTDFVLNKGGIPWPLVLICIIPKWFFSSLLKDKESFYYHLENKYKNETHRELKSCLIIGYTLSTLLFFCLFPLIEGGYL